MGSKFKYIHFTQLSRMSFNIFMVYIISEHLGERTDKMEDGGGVGLNCVLTSCQ